MCNFFFRNQEEPVAPNANLLKQNKGKVQNYRSWESKKQEFGGGEGSGNIKCETKIRYQVCTTGNASFAESLRLCREPEALPRATSRALGKGHSLPRASPKSPRQRLALSKEAFAEGQALGKERPSTKTIFAEGHGPRQIWPVGSRRPRLVSLCRGTAVRPSAKFF
jgi:hypothetical protein